MVYKIIIQMEQTFSPKQIIWAKVKGYPWWPAKIVKLPSQQAQVFKVQFIAEDTHAFLNPRDVRKYQEYYDECSKKKMRGLVPAIQTADQLHKKRIQILPIGGGTSIDKLVRPKLSPKKKFIKRVYRKRKQESSHSSSSDNDPSSSSQKVQVQKEEVQVQVQVSIEKQESEDISDQNIEDQKLDVESDQKVDRNKIDIVEDSLLKIVEKIKENEYVFNQQDFLNLQNLSCEELLMGKITNILNFILGKLTLNSSQNNDTRWLKHFRQGLKQKIVDHLYDTTYYDQYIKLIQKNKRSRNEYQGSLIAYLRNQYRIKKELALVFASRLVAQINNGTVSRQKQLLEDIKEHRVDLLNMNNKAAVDRCIEALIPKYM